MSLGARSGLRGGRVAIAALSLLLLVGLPVQAADPSPPVDRSAGSTGAHSLPDSMSSPAGRCRYGYDVPGEGYYNGVRKIRVVAPVAYARTNRAHQRISARLVVQYWKDDAWHKYAATSWQWRSATPTHRADFTARSIIIDSRPFHGVAEPWRARVDLRWHASDGVTVKGTARMFPRWYDTWEGTNHLGVQADDCGGTTG
jgi:hypothetical protein